MMAKIIRLIVTAVIALGLLSAVVTFFKKAKNQTRSQTKAQLKKAKIFRFDALIIALVLCAAEGASVYMDTAKQASALISLNYAEASQGQNTNGTRYNMSEIICDEVMERTIEKGGFEDVSVSDLKSCLSVSPLVQGNSYSKDDYHISTEFVINYTAGKKTKKYSAETVMQLLCNSYRDYYFDKYVNDFDISPSDFEETDEKMDFIDTTTLLGKKANKVLNYLYGLQSKNSSFVSSSGATFASVAAKVYNLNETQINDTLYAFVLQNGISDDSQLLIKRLSYANVQAGYQKQEQQQSYNTTHAAIQKYDKDMATVVLVPTWDNEGQYYMGRTKVGIDTLSVQSVSYSEKIASIEKGIKDNNLKLEKFGTSEHNTKANKESAKALIAGIRTSLKKLAEEARAIGQEYYSNQMNQCISATVYAGSFLSQMKKILLVFAAAYIVFAAKKAAEQLSDDEMRA